MFSRSLLICWPFFTFVLRRIQSVAQTTLHSAKKPQAYATTYIRKNRHGLLSVVPAILTPFTVTVTNITFSITFSITQLNNPTSSTSPSRVHLGSLFHQGPQNKAKSSAAIENVPQMFSGTSSAAPYFYTSRCYEVTASWTETCSRTSWTTRWLAATNGRSRVATKCIETVSLRREDVLSDQAILSNNMSETGSYKYFLA